MSTPLSDTSSPGAPSTPQVHRLQPADAARWDEFVMGCPEATFFHRAGWQQVLERAFGHDTYYLYAEINGCIEGILPLGHMRSRLFGNALVSLPFCVYGGVAAMSAAARTALDPAAREVTEPLH